MKIAIVGAGAMGSVYGAFLAESGNEVWFLDIFKEHINNINNYGLYLKGENDEKVIKGIRATSDPEEVGVVDLAIVFVKSIVTDIAIDQNKSIIGKDTIVLTLQNGLGNIEKLSTVIPRENIIAGTTSHGANLLGPGRVKHAGHGATIIGELDGQISYRINKISQVFKDAKLDPVSISNNVIGLIWDKLLVNVGINPITALTELRNGQIIEFPEAENILEAAVTEATLVSKALGIRLEHLDPVQHCKDVCKVTGENISSMLADVNKKRRTEINMINGAIVKEGEMSGVETPVNKVLTNLILLKEKQY